MKDYFPTLKTDRLLLRQLIDTDLGHVFYGLSHPDVIKYYGISFDSLEATQEQMVWFEDLLKTETGIWWAICAQNNSTCYGAAGFSSINKVHRKAEIGFWLLPEFWGLGVVGEALPVICNHGFDKLHLHRIEGFVESENTNCHRTMAKLGFLHEGTMKDCETKNGRYISLDIYAKLMTT